MKSKSCVILFFLSSSSFLLTSCAFGSVNQASLSNKFANNQISLENKRIDEKMLCKSFLKQSSELYIHPDGAYRSAILAVNKAQEYKEMVLGFKKANQQDARAEDLNELINKNPNDYTEIECSLMDNDSLRSRKIGEIGTIKGACNNININDNTIYEYTREGADIKKYVAYRDSGKLCTVHTDPILFGTAVRLSNAVQQMIQSKL